MEKNKEETSRRNFLKGITMMPLMGRAAAGVSETGKTDPKSAANQQDIPASSAPAPKQKFVAIQIGARSFVDEGVEKCLDTLQEKGGVNTLMNTVFTYGRGLAGALRTRWIPAFAGMTVGAGMTGILQHTLPAQGCLLISGKCASSQKTYSRSDRFSNSLW